MDNITLNWEEFSFKESELIPNFLQGAQGLYLIKYYAEPISYVGLAKEDGAFKRAKDHFRGSMDSTGICILKGRVKNKITFWIAWIEQGENIEPLEDAEKLLIFKLQPRCNIKNRNKYSG